MNAQVSHFTRLERLFCITRSFKLSRLFRKQWRTNPAVAIASFTTNVYKRRSGLTAQNADVAPTTVGVTYLRFMENVKTDTCALYNHHRHICVRQQNLIIHKSLFCREAKLLIVWNAILALTKH